MAWVVEISGYELGVGASTKVYAMGRGIAFTDSTYAAGQLKSWRSPTQKLDISRSGGVELSGDAGELVLANVPNDLATAGPLDVLATGWAWGGRRANFYWVPALLWANRTLISSAIMEQPVAQLTQDARLESVLRFPLRDPRKGLDAPLQTVKFLGQVENLALQSEDFATSHTATGITVTPNALVAPNGSLTGDLLTVTAGGANNIVQAANYTVTASTAYNYSFYVRRGTLADMHYRIRNITAGSDIVASTSYFSQTSASAWVRVNVSFTTPVGCVAVSATPLLNEATGTAYFWGEQMVAGATVKPYLRTTTAAIPLSEVEGDANVRGRPKPVCYGVVSNIPGVRVNAAKLIWQVADKSATILCVRDGGGSLTAGTARGSLASMLSNIPTPGTYDTYAGTEGTFVRLGSAPFKDIGIDVQEGATTADRTHAQVWKRIRIDRCGNVSGDITAAAVTATDVADPFEVGFWWTDETTQLAAVNEVLTSLSGYEVQGFDLKWNIAKLLVPSGATVIDLMVVQPASAMTSKSRALTTLNRARPSFAPDGIPPYRVTVNWGHNYTPMTETDFIGAAPQRLRDKFATEWRSEMAQDNAVWDPVAATGPWLNAPELSVKTGYQPGADFITCPQALTEAQRLLSLYSNLRAQYEAGFVGEMTDRLLPGDVVSVTHAQMGLNTGPLFRVLQAAWRVEDSRLTTSLVVGLQT